MIVLDPQRQLDNVLNQIAIELDIPPHKHKEAIERFGAIKRHLEAGDYPNSMRLPDVYLQGSFRLGTVIRPVRGGEDCDFDIDIVCEVNRDKDSDDPEYLKNDVGNEVKGYAKKKGMHLPKNSRRCWALEYAPDSEGVGFHVDILPCLPDYDVGMPRRLMDQGNGAIDRQYAQTTIAITNRDDAVEPPVYDWRSSNPRGYGSWFTGICRPGYDYVDSKKQKMLLFEIHGQRQHCPFDKPQDIPDALVRTPLQRAIQIMKRHRDVRFDGHEDEKHKPISMIITTLAARLCEGRTSEYRTTRSVLRFIIETLAKHADLVENGILLEDISCMQLIRRVGDKWYIPSPVNPHNPGDSEEEGENFADRWHEDNHAKAKVFFKWLEWLRADLDSLMNGDGSIAEMGKTLANAFGQDIATRAVSHLREESDSSWSGAMVEATSTAITRFDVPHRDEPVWPRRFTNKVTIECEATRKGWRTLRSTLGFKRIAKRYSLRFEANTNVGEPYQVYWQVVNTGTEAEEQDGLRGSIFLGTRVHAEATEYTGLHWIECFIVKDGILVARSGEFVVNIQ